MRRLQKERMHISWNLRQYELRYLNHNIQGSLFFGLYSSYFSKHPVGCHVVFMLIYPQWAFSPDKYVETNFFFTQEQIIFIAIDKNVSNKSESVLQVVFIPCLMDFFNSDLHCILRQFLSVLKKNCVWKPTQYLFVNAKFSGVTFILCSELNLKNTCDVFGPMLSVCLLQYL